MKRATLISVIVLGLAGLAAAGGLYWHASKIDNTRLERAVTLVQSLQALDSRWSVELLQVSANPQADFDGLASISPEVTRHSKELRAIARKDPAVSPELKSATLAYIAKLQSKDERIERFKSAYAIVRNSERYLPLAAQLVQARTGEFQQAGLRQAVSTHHEELKNYFARPTEIEKQRIMLALESLQATRAEYPPTLGTALGNFLAHAQVLMQQIGPLNELRASATSLEGTSSADGLIEELRAVMETRTQERATLETSAFGLAFAVLLGMVLFFALGRRGAPAGAAAAAVAAAPAAAVQTMNRDTTETTLDLSTPALDLYHEFGGATVEESAPANDSERVQREYLTQVVRASARHLSSHMKMMRQIYSEVSTAVSDCQNTLIVGDTHSANTAIVSAKAKLGELGDLLDLNTVPKLLDATTRSVQIADRASGELNDSLKDAIESEKVDVDLTRCVEIALNQAVPGDSSVTVDRTLLPVSMVQGSPDELASAFAFIITNAVEELEETDRPGVVRVQTSEELGVVSVTIADNGRGMDTRDRQAALGAFFSKKEGRRGIGLSAALYVVKKHGGRVQMNSMPGKGTVVRVQLPADGEELPPE